MNIKSKKTTESEIQQNPVSLNTNKKAKKIKKKSKKVPIIILITLLILLIGIAVCSVFAVTKLTGPKIKDCDSYLGRSPGKDVFTTVTGCVDYSFVVESGQSVDEISENLEETELIVSAKAFAIYVKISGKASQIQAGTHTLNAGMDMFEVVDKLLESPEVKTFNIMFLPGGTLQDAKKVLKSHGYSDSDIDAAFSKNYDHPVLQGKPDTADLEGYIYGETYQFYENASVETIIETCLDELYKVVQEQGLVEKYAARGFNLFEGITLASIIQRETGNSDDQDDIARVFLNRLEVGMTLGSDVTYQYICDKLGIDRDYNYDSPYNTRLYGGLTPGPISSPGKTALLAVANPADNDYLYFLTGDDGKMYYGHTDADHQYNIVNHCQEMCQII